MFFIEKDYSKSDQTVVAGAAIYFDILKSIGFYKKFKDCFKNFHPQQGWDAISIVLVIIFMNILGHEHVEYSHQIERSFASSRTLFKSENFLTCAL